MADLSDTIATAPREIILGGKKVLIGIMDLNDWAELEKQAKHRIRERRKQKLAVAKECYAEQIPIPVFESITAPFTAAEITEEISTIESSTFLMTRLIQKCNPDLSNDEIMSLIKISDINQIMEDAGITDDQNLVKETTEKKAKPGIKPPRRLAGHQQ